MLKNTLFNYFTKDKSSPSTKAEVPKQPSVKRKLLKAKEEKGSLPQNIPLNGFQQKAPGK